MSLDMEMNLDKVCKMKEKFTCWLETETNKGVEAVDTKEAGEVADIIKDLAQAESYCREAEYYKVVTEAMERPTAMDDFGRFGYNMNRYPSSGSFASKGHGMNGMNGNVAGFKPYLDQEPYVDAYLHDPDFERNMRMGYHEGQMTNGMRYDNSRHGKVYDGYTNAKRYYTETKSHSDKIEMEKYSKEYLEDAMMVLREMWSDAEPSQRQKMKEDLTKFVNTLSA